MDLSSSSSEDGNKAKDFLNELSTLQTNNLSQTFDLIADMKEEMGDIKEKLAKTENKLAETEEKLAEMSEKTEQQESQIESLSFQIDSLGARGHWCGNKDSWYKDDSTITYDSIFYSDSNMNITDTPLDIKTGNYSHSVIIIIWILIFVIFQGSSLCRCLDLQHVIPGERRGS